jgi:thymidylate synthase (FAD)
MNKMKIDVLNKGFIDCQDIFGNELTIVNCARVSFGKKKEIFDANDEKLIKYLIQHEHYSPFRHIFFRFHIKAPEFVMRQWYKHVVGCEWTSSSSSQLHGWNEISGRYIEYADNDYYIPEKWRKQSQDKKQGSDGSFNQDVQIKYHESFQTIMNLIMTEYKNMIQNDIAKEQARILLPLNIYTEVIWTVSLQALMNFIKLRNEEHAQYEIREYAKVLNDLVNEHFPNVVKYWI